MTQYEILQKYFGYTTFRKGQELLIKSILQGQDVLGIMPTGAGKSICYQVPALMMEGITLVVSPLISLMKDQVTALNQAGVHAAYINSSLTERQISMALANAARGQYKIIYVAPERLETPVFLEFALNSNISMVTIDEAHCISQWGQDFRPSYLKIVEFIRHLPKRPVVSAFTATATLEVKDDIICILGLQDANVLITGFNRENLFFEVRTPEKKSSELLEYIKEHNADSGIIYCATRKNVEKVHELLVDNGVEAAKYHAGLSNEERQQNQEDFIYDKKIVMVATNAFGMGIDKSNVRYVIHFNMPQSLENYYQEAGRAGRDGEPSECILLYSPQDIMINHFLIESGSANSELSYEDAMVIQERDEERLNKMIGYCLTKQCLRNYILQYFGESTSKECEHCSNCLAEGEEIDITDLSIDIINCIHESRQRYGVRVIIGTLRGETYAKLMSYGVNRLKSYGIAKEVSEGKLQQIINYLIVEGYLTLTKDKYSLIKLTPRVDDLLQGLDTLTMKYHPEKEKKKSTAITSTRGKTDLLTSKGLDLFDKLRMLRMELAKEENVPPYIICSDKTLVDMCVKLPHNKAEMLAVNGVGENKYEKYGERFVTHIRMETGDVREGYCFEGAELEMKNQGAVQSRNKKTRKKQEFSLTHEMAEQLEYYDVAPLSSLVDQMNDLRDEGVMKRITGVSIMKQLTEDGYIQEVEKNGRINRSVTQKGIDFGIILEIKHSQKGFPYEVFSFTEEAQREIVKMVMDGRIK